MKASRECRVRRGGVADHETTLETEKGGGWYDYVTVFAGSCYDLFFYPGLVNVQKLA